jgi:hypothetical protein
VVGREDPRVEELETSSIATSVGGAEGRRSGTSAGAPMM